MNFKYCPLCKNKLRKINLTGVGRMKCAECGWIRYENPLPSVVAVVKRGNKILLIKRGVAPHIDKWCFPTGFVEVEETPETACVRELEEEAGLKGKIGYLIGVYSEKSRLYKKVIVIAYWVKAEDKEPLPGDDAKEAKFFSLDNLPDLPFVTHLQIIRDIIKKSDLSP